MDTGASLFFDHLDPDPDPDPDAAIRPGTRTVE